MTGPGQAAETWPLALLLVAAAAALSAGLIVVLLPALRRHALAKPNARSSHVEPTPQGGGIAVVVATVIVALAAVTLTSPPGERAQLAWVLGAAALIAAVGAVDDMRAMPVLPRLLLQALAARGLGKLAAVAVGIARMDVARLDHVVADARVVVTDRLALDGKARHACGGPERSGHRQVEPDLHAISSIRLRRLPG